MHPNAVIFGLLHPVSPKEIIIPQRTETVICRPDVVKTEEDRGR